MPGGSRRASRCGGASRQRRVPQAPRSPGIAIPGRPSRDSESLHFSSAIATVCFTNSTLEILAHFDELTDPRRHRTKLHPLTDLVAIALCATICEAAGWADVERFGRMKQDWFAIILELPNGIPSNDTFGRVFARLDTDEFLACLERWVRDLHRSLKDQGIAIDGKTLRRSFDTATGRSALHTVSAWACDLRLCLAQVAVDDKSNEITAVPKLLERVRSAADRWVILAESPRPRYWTGIIGRSVAS